MSTMADEQRESEVPVEASIAAQIAELRSANLKTLRGKFREIVGREPPRWSHRTTLVQKLAWAIQARELGGLKEQTLAMIEVLAKDPAIGLYAASTDPATPVIAPKRETRVYRIGRKLDPRVPLPATSITRSYRGRNVTVKVLADGFEHEGVRYRTLSAVAKHVTGQHMSGMRFFGFAQRKENSKTGETT